MRTHYISNSTFLSFQSGAAVINERMMKKLRTKKKRRTRTSKRKKKRIGQKTKRKGKRRSWKELGPVCNELYL